MKHLIDIQDDLANNKAQDALLDGLLHYVLATKKFTFDPASFTLDANLLIDHKLISQNGNTLNILATDQFHYKFYTHFIEAFSFELTENVKEAFEFADKINSMFDGTQGSAGRYGYMRSFRTFLVFAIHKSFNSDFCEYALSLKTESKENYFYEFAGAFYNILPHSNISAKSLFKILNHLTVEVLKENSRDVSGLYLSLRSLGKLDPERAKLLLEISLSQQQDLHNLNIPLLSELLESNWALEFSTIKTLYVKGIHCTSIICALSNVLPLTIEEARNSMELILSRRAISFMEACNLPRYFSTYAKLEDQTFFEECFNQLFTLWNHPEHNVRAHILSELRFLDNRDFEIVAFLKRSIEQPDYDHKLDHALGEVFLNHKNLITYFDFLVSYAIKFKLHPLDDTFSSSYYQFRNSDSKGFSLALISMLTHDKGEVRFAGNQILSSINLHHGSFRFDADLVSLTAETQYRLIVSVLERITEPKASLPILLPLLKSRFNLIREILLCKLELMTESYHGAVLVALDGELDMSDSENAEAHKRVKEYNEAFSQLLDKKKGLKELDPYYVQSRYINAYRKQHSKSFRSKMNSEVHNNSILSMMATTVILAKGGGWKHENQNKISQLGKIEHSMMLPRLYFIAPEYMDWELHNNSLQDWSETFKEWIAIVLSSENT